MKRLKLKAKVGSFFTITKDGVSMVLRVYKVGSHLHYEFIAPAEFEIQRERIIEVKGAA